MAVVKGKPSKKQEARLKPSRSLTTEILTRAATHYLAHKRFSCHIEFGVEAWGKRRLDIIAMNTKGVTIGCEVKSCVADYRTDKKWKAYLPYVNKMYMVFSEELYSKPKFIAKVKPVLKKYGVGIMVLSEGTGYIYVAQNAKVREVDPAVQRSMLVRMAWRGGESRRTIKRRQRLYLTK